VKWPNLLLGIVAVMGLLAAVPANAQQGNQEQTASRPLQPLPFVLLPDKPSLEPKALAILKAASDRLAAAHTLSFTALATYESPARTLQPLAYTVLSEVTLERPDKLRVISPGDGPPSEFYYDGKTITAYEPQSNLVAVANAPPTVDAMLKFAFDKAAVYFPFADIIVADPYKDLAPGLRLAFVIGQSRVVGGTLTDMVALASEHAQAEIWIGVDDKLPRMVRATFFNEPGNFRHAVEFSNWRLDPTLPPGTFASDRAAKATRINFASPDEKLPQGQ
jgi:hypothetical protein